MHKICIYRYIYYVYIYMYIYIYIYYTTIYICIFYKYKLTICLLAWPISTVSALLIVILRSQNKAHSGHPRCYGARSVISFAVEPVPHELTVDGTHINHILASWCIKLVIESHKWPQMQSHIWDFMGFMG